MKIVLTILTLVLLITSCDTCDNGSGGTGTDEYTILFSSKAAGEDLPGLMEINSDGSHFSKIIDNAKIFSSMSDNSELVFTRNINNLNELHYFRLGEQSTTLIDKDNSFFTIEEPVISPDGTFIAFKSSDSTAFLYDLTKSSLQQLNVTNAIVSNLVFNENSNELVFFVEKSNPVLLNYNVINSTVSNEIEFPGYDYNANRNNIYNINNKFCFTLKGTDFDNIYYGDFGNFNFVSISKEFLGANAAYPGRNFEEFVFSTDDGRLFIVEVNVQRTFQIKDNNRGLCLFPKFSPDNQKISYIRSSSIIENVSLNYLEIADYSFEDKIMINKRTLSKLSGSDSGIFWKLN